MSVENGFYNPFNLQESDFLGESTGADSIEGQIKAKRDEIGGLLLGLGIPSTTMLSKSIIGSDAFKVATKKLYQNIFGDEKTVQGGEEGIEKPGEALGNSEPADPISLAKQGGAEELQDLSGKGFNMAEGDDLPQEVGLDASDMEQIGNSIINPAFEGDGVSEMQGIVNNTLNGLDEQLNTFASSGNELLNSATSTVEQGLNTLRNTAQSTITDAVSTARNAAGNVADSVVNTVSDTLGAARDVVQGAVSTASDAIDGAVGTIEGVGAGLDLTGVGSLAGLGVSIIGGLVEAGIALKDLFEGTSRPEVAAPVFSPGV